MKLTEVGLVQGHNFLIGAVSVACAKEFEGVGHFRCWHFSDMALRSLHVRY
jgi:hypothetical protein